VLVLDKARFPRYKACGGAVPWAILRRFPFSFDNVPSVSVHQVCYSLTGRKEIRVILPGRPIAMFMRDRLDMHLLRHCGAQIREECAVRQVTEETACVRIVTANGERLCADYLIGADGASSLVAQQVGLARARRPGAAIEVEAPADRHLLQQYADTALFEFGAVPNGYLWIFPKGDHLSIGAGTLRSTRADLRGILQREMARRGLHLNNTAVHAHLLPVYPGRKRFATRRCLLVGDAAGLLDGLIGEGIRYAIQSGELAAQSILQGRVADYTRLLHRRIGSNLMWANLGGRIFYNLPRFSFYFGAANPRSTRGFVRVFENQHSYGWLVLHILGCVAESAVTFKWLKPKTMSL